MDNTVSSDTIREMCLVCGLTANLDPFLHADRYRHLPRVRRDGQVLEFSYYTGTFSTVIEDD